MENKNISKVKRGEIYLYDFGTNEGSIQNGLRPALVVQCDEGNKASCTTVIAAMTTVINEAVSPVPHHLGRPLRAERAVNGDAGAAPNGQPSRPLGVHRQD